MNNNVLHDHGEPDDVDSDGDFKFDIIYRHHDVKDGVSMYKSGYWERQHSRWERRNKYIMKIAEIDT